MGTNYYGFLEWQSGSYDNWELLRDAWWAKHTPEGRSIQYKLNLQRLASRALSVLDGQRRQASSDRHKAKYGKSYDEIDREYYPV